MQINFLCIWRNGDGPIGNLHRFAIGGCALHIYKPRKMDDDLLWSGCEVRLQMKDCLIRGRLLQCEGHWAEVRRRLAYSDRLALPIHSGETTPSRCSWSPSSRTSIVRNSVLYSAANQPCGDRLS